MNNSLVDTLRVHVEKKVSPNGHTYLSLSTKSASLIAKRNNYSIKEIEIQSLKNKIVPERYQRNIGTVGIDDQLKLLKSQVAVVGVGGLGGAVLELLVRLGVGKIVIIDGDFFIDSNLNRQILSSCKNIGKKKVDIAKQRVREVNPAVEVQVYSVVSHEKNLSSMIRGSQVVVDGLDDIQARFSLEKVCKKMDIPFVHGAIAGFVGQVMTIFPDDKGLQLIYGSEHTSKSGIEKNLGTPGITPTAVATWQVSEAVKILLGWEKTLRNRVLIFDLKEQIMEIVAF
jgi:molybdopterin/thiamine biosynthesis adenylyltransferase